MDTEQLLHFFFDGLTLKRVPRSGWLLRNVPQVESVAEHSHSVALVTLALLDVLNASGPPAAPLDTGRALTIALLHDLAESRLTDIPGPALRYLPAEAKSKAESAALADILRGLPSSGHFEGLWHEYESSASPEGKLVRDADRLEMMVQCLRYERSGVRGLEEFWEAMDRHVWHYPLSADLYARLRMLRPAV